MNLKSLLIPLLLMSYTPTTYADEGLDISYKVPFLPLEITFGSDGISFHGTKTIVTPIGSFSLGYSKYASKFDEDYTYVIIEDMNLKKEHIYKINDKKKLKLVSEGRTEMTVTKNRVRIVVEKGSRFTVKFSVEGEDEVRESSSSDLKWIIPSKSVCKSNGGEINVFGCESTWLNAKKICNASQGSLPTINLLRKMVTNCGGEINRDIEAVKDRNRYNDTYEKCYEKKGFSLWYHWSDTSYSSTEVWSLYVSGGSDKIEDKIDTGYVMCTSEQ